MSRPPRSDVVAVERDVEGSDRRLVTRRAGDELRERRLAEFKHTAAAVVTSSGWTANHAAVHALERRGACLVSGTAVTTRMSNAARFLPEEMAHPFFDMETAGIAQIAAEHGTALMALRAVSDGPLEPLSFDLEAMTDEDFNLSILKAFKMVLLRPQLALGSFRIIRNVGKAAENAAVALAAVLGQAVILEELKGKVRIPVECLPSLKS